MKNTIFLHFLPVSLMLFFVGCGEDESMVPQIINSKVSMKIDGKLWESQKVNFKGNAFEAGDWESFGLLRVHLNEDALTGTAINSFDYENFSGGISAAWFITPEESNDVSQDTAYYAFEGETIILKNDGKTIEGTFYFEGRTPALGSNAVRVVDPPVSASFTEGIFVLDLSELQ